MGGVTLRPWSLMQGLSGVTLVLGKLPFQRTRDGKKLTHVGAPVTTFSETKQAKFREFLHKMPCVGWTLPRVAVAAVTVDRMGLATRSGHYLDRGEEEEVA